MFRTTSIALNRICTRHWLSSSAAGLHPHCTAVLFRKCLISSRPSLLSPSFCPFPSDVLRKGFSEGRRAHGGYMTLFCSCLLPRAAVESDSSLARKKVVGGTNEGKSYFPLPKGAPIALKRWPLQQHRRLVAAYILPFRKALSASLNQMRMEKEDMTRGKNGE